MDTVKEYMTRHYGDFVAIRHDLHQFPELGFEERRTSDSVCKLLASWGYEVHTGYGKTGVLGVLRKGSGNKRIGIRADMDALPIQELNEVDHRSRHDNVMHACGHDGHTTMVLAAARYLAEHGTFDGTLNVIFQPAEESLGGARQMIEDGLFKDHPCDAVFALHNTPGFPAGHLLFRDGATMCSSDYVTVTLTGVGGHGAYPHKTRDPIVAAASIVMALQTIVSREVSPSDHAVITVGAINAGFLNNVIPQQARLEISVRSLSPEVRKLLQRRITALVTAQAESYGVTADVDYRSGYPVLVNTPEHTEFARSLALKVFGQEKVIAHAEARLGSEDFAFMLEEVPGCYFFLGNGASGTHGSCPVHNPHYDFNDSIIVDGATFWVHLVQNFLK